MKIKRDMDIPICVTPVHFVENINGNEIYMKREDMLPYSFGGNKVRFAQNYLQDMRRKKSDALIIYGGNNSNLCRILTNVCACRNIPCAKVHNVDDDEKIETTLNSRLIDAAGFRGYPCHKKDISDAVQRAMDEFRQQGRKPYYIYGNIFGSGNAFVPMRAYYNVYEEICGQEAQLGLHFDMIFLASGTNTTQAGLLAGHLEKGDERKIVGISSTRNQVRAREVILEDLAEYAEKSHITYKLAENPEVYITDSYLAGGYGRHNEEILKTIRRIYLAYGIPLDATYTGKAYRGMEDTIRKENCSGKKILFLHTGGAPLFLDLVSKGTIFKEKGRKNVSFGSDPMLQFGTYN